MNLFINQSKNWSEDIAIDSWALFKIISEFVTSYEKMSKIGPCVSNFSSVRTSPDDPQYKLASEIAEVIVKSGFGIITGGRPGIMEAANLGAKTGGEALLGSILNCPLSRSTTIILMKIN